MGRLTKKDTLVTSYKKLYKSTCPGYHNPEECDKCDGSGRLVEYKNGAIAKWLGGPFV